MLTTTSTPTFSKRGFLNRCEQDYIPKVAFQSGDSATNLNRVEHVCTAPLAVLQRAFPDFKYDGNESFQAHGDRFRLCFFANDVRKQLYCGVHFSRNAEGPPNNVHGGAIATVVDIALATLAAHFCERACVTTDLRVIYEKPIPLGSEVIIRCWFYQTGEKRFTAHCDIVSPRDMTRYDRGFATFALIPKKAGSSFATIPTAEIEKRVLELCIEEEDQNEMSLTSSPVAKPPTTIEFPLSSPLPERYKNWEVMDFCQEFPDVINLETRGFIGVHKGKHFDFMPNGGSILNQIFRDPQTNRIEGLVFFSRFAGGPPGSVHGGAIAAAFDSLFGDSVFFVKGWGHMTRMLAVEYKLPIPPNSVVVYQDVEVFDNPQRRGVYIKGKLTDGNGKVFCKGMAEFALAAKETFPFEKMRDRFGRTSGKSREENLKEFADYAIKGKGKL